jgi:DNA-binding NarL/FixJ family response regulator
MDSTKQIIAIVGPSLLIQYGLAEIIKEHLPGFLVCNFKDLQLLQNLPKHGDLAAVIIDASIADSNLKTINSLKKEFAGCSLILLQYQYISASLISQFDELITIEQSPVEIASIINKAMGKIKEMPHEVKTDNLSERETDVLKLLVTGFSAKEIADRLNISVNTVISHRKNISIKTGIKSLAGLTIYAVANKIITMDSLQK